MLGFITRGLVLVLGYAYPAYECYKTVKKNRVEIEELRVWCQYWILVSIMTVFEKFGDLFLSWLPFYGEMKLALFIYLWYPKTKGTGYIYGTCFRPYIAKHEPEIDRNIHELRVKAWDLTLTYWQNCSKMGQATFFQILQFLAAQSGKVSKAKNEVLMCYFAIYYCDIVTAINSTTNSIMNNTADGGSGQKGSGKGSMSELAKWLVVGGGCLLLVAFFIFILVHLYLRYRYSLESFPVVRFPPKGTIGHGNTVCSICLEEFRETETLRVLRACKHMYHIDCIRQWFDKSRECPTCRHDYSYSVLVQSFFFF